MSGTAGTGKSFVISALVTRIRELLGLKAVLVVAPTGVASHNIKGSTLIIDEMSMIGASLFGAVDRRCRQIWPKFNGEVFGGRSVLLVGDFGQIPPVGDRALFCCSATGHNISKFAFTIP